MADLVRSESHDQGSLLERDDSFAAGGHGRERLESENQQLLREVLTCRRNLDIAHQNIATLKALSNQLAAQLNTSQAEIAILRERRDAAELRAVRDADARAEEVRASYEARLAELRRELDEQLDVSTRLATESQDAHRRADRSFRDIVATKDGLIAELTRTVECLQAGLRIGGDGGGGGDDQQQQSSSTRKRRVGTTLSSPARRGPAPGGVRPSEFDAVAVRNSIIEPTLDLLRLNLRVMKTDIATRTTPLGEVNSSMSSSARQHVTRYFVDVMADKHRLDEVPTVDLRVATPQHGNKHFVAAPAWPRVWRFHTPQGELITLSLDVATL
jgi:hypothetical protein